MSNKTIKRKFKNLDLTLAERMILSGSILSTAARVCSDAPEKDGPHPLNSKASYIMAKALDAIDYDEIENLREEKAEEAEDGVYEFEDEELEASNTYKIKSAVYVFIKRCLKYVQWNRLAIKDMDRLEKLLDTFNLSDELDRFMEDQFKDDDEEWETEVEDEA